MDVLNNNPQADPVIGVDLAAALELCLGIDGREFCLKGASRIL